VQFLTFQSKYFIQALLFRIILCIRFHLKSNIACYEIKIQRISEYIDIHMHFIKTGMLRMTGPISFSTSMSLSF